jgi:hypothetical protein
MAQRKLRNREVIEVSDQILRWRKLWKSGQVPMGKHRQKSRDVYAKGTEQAKDDEAIAKGRKKFF